MKFMNGVALKLISAVFSPLGAAVAAVAIAIGAAAIAISSEWDNIKKLFSDFAGWVYDWVVGVGESIYGLAGSVGEAMMMVFTSPIEAIKIAWTGLKDFIGGIFSWVADTAWSIASLVGGTVANIGTGPQAVGEFFGVGGTPGFASGGTSAGGVIRVGESGPETMIVPPGTKIAPHDPNNAGARGMAGVTLNVYSPTFLDEAQMDRFNTGIGKVISEQLRAAGSFA
jgi:phage-related protein